MAAYPTPCWLASPSRGAACLQVRLCGQARVGGAGRRGRAAAVLGRDRRERRLPFRAACLAVPSGGISAGAAVVAPSIRAPDLQPCGCCPVLGADRLPRACSPPPTGDSRLVFGTDPRKLDGCAPTAAPFPAGEAAALGTTVRPWCCISMETPAVLGCLSCVSGARLAVVQASQQACCRRGAAQPRPRPAGTLFASHDATLCHSPGNRGW